MQLLVKGRAFTEALSITGLKDVSTLSLHILKKNSPATVFNEIPAGCLASDTLVWLSTTADASGLTLSFRGYARCSATMLFSLSKQTIPATLLLAALLWGGFTFFYFHRHTKTNASNGQQQENFITFGNLSLSLQEACFYNEQQEKLKLTPMQYTLMEMFYLSSSHLLFKSDICQSLWPGKDNADETLYTLIRRLKPIVEDNSNLTWKEVLRHAPFPYSPKEFRHQRVQGRCPSAFHPSHHGTQQRGATAPLPETGRGGKGRHSVKGFQGYHRNIRRCLWKNQGLTSLATCSSCPT